MYKSIALGMISSVMIGCAITPQQSAEIVPKIEGHYINQAKKNAAFLTDCPMENVKFSILERAQEIQQAVFKKLTYVKIEPIKSIGINACGTKYIYSVYCKLDDLYVGKYSYLTKQNYCDVFQEGTTAAAQIMTGDLAKRNDLAKRQAAAQAAARAQAAAKAAKIRAAAKPIY